MKELKILCDNNFIETGAALPESIATIFDNDPHVIFPGNLFVFTGDFMWGTMASLDKAVEQRGGIVKNYISRKTNYLVVGSRASPEWITENFGLKIQKAAEMENSGNYEISIIREADWVIALD
jgi:NAD-dependent DNA ligase